MLARAGESGKGFCSRCHSQTRQPHGRNHHKNWIKWRQTQWCSVNNHRRPFPPRLIAQQTQLPSTGGDAITTIEHIMNLCSRRVNGVEVLYQRLFAAEQRTKHRAIYRLLSEGAKAASDPSTTAHEVASLADSPVHPLCNLASSRILQSPEICPNKNVIEKSCTCGILILL